jgi:hypothetical protein
MKLSDLIEQAQRLMAREGDLEVLVDVDFYAMSKLTLLEVEEDDQFPKDWNMPKGSKFAKVEYDY